MYWFLFYIIGSVLSVISFANDYKTDDGYFVIEDGFDFTMILISFLLSWFGVICFLPKFLIDKILPFKIKIGRKKRGD